MPIRAPTFLGRGRLEVLEMESQSLGDWTLGAGLLGTTAQDRNFSWVFWLVLWATGQRWQMDRGGAGALHSPGQNPRLSSVWPEGSGSPPLALTSAMVILD